MAVILFVLGLVVVLADDYALAWGADHSRHLDHDPGHNLFIHNRINDWARCGSRAGV